MRSVVTMAVVAAVVAAACGGGGRGGAGGGGGETALIALVEMKSAEGPVFYRTEAMFGSHGDLTKGPEFEVVREKDASRFPHAARYSPGGALRWRTRGVRRPGSSWCWPAPRCTAWFGAAVAV